MERANWPAPFNLPPDPREPTPVARAYDAIAVDYDAATAGDAWMRTTLWTHYLRRFQPGDRVLDVGCGTGLDTMFLAQHGIHVTGIDISPGMIDQLRAKTDHDGLLGRIDARVGDMNDLSGLDAQSFDGIISGFACLNTADDLSRFSADAVKLLKPHGHAVLHILNRFSLWEFIALVHGLHLRQAVALSRRRDRSYVIGGITVGHRLYGTCETYECFFARDFRLVSAYGLGSLRPPYTSHVPATLAAGLARLDHALGSHPPFRDCGRFFVLDLMPRAGGAEAHDT